MPGRWRQNLLAGFVGLFVASSASSQVLKKDSDLLATDGGTETVATVKAGVAVEVLERRGFWVRVRASGQVGWTKVTTLQFGAGAGGKVGIDTGRLSKGNIVASSAARGMSRGEFLDAEPDERELAALLEFAPSEVEVDQFREAGRLIERKITPLTVASKADSESASSAGDGVAPAGRARKPKEKRSDDW